MSCERNHEHCWNTDNAGYKWYDETYPKPVDNAPRELGEWPMQQVDGQPVEPMQAPTLPTLPERTDIVGYIGVGDNGQGYCPYCGGKLSAGS